MEHQWSSPPGVSSHSYLSMSLISARFFHLCEKYAWCSDSGFSFDILLTTETGNWPLETLEVLYSNWYTSESSCSGVFVPYFLDILCVLSKTLSGTYMLPVLLHADPYSICYLLSVTAVPCPALSLTLGCCKSNTRKQTSSNKHWRGVSCSVCFSTSHYHIMLLISHADSHRWHFVLGSN